MEPTDKDFLDELESCLTINEQLLYIERPGFVEFIEFKVSAVAACKPIGTENDQLDFLNGLTRARNDLKALNAAVSNLDSLIQKRITALRKDVQYGNPAESSTTGAPFYPICDNGRQLRRINPSR